VSQTRRLRIQMPDPGTMLPLSLRQGLPPGFVYQHGLHATLCTLHDPSTLANPKASDTADDSLLPRVTAEVASEVARRLRDAAAVLEGCGTVITTVAGHLTREFMRDRLPPFSTQLPPVGPQPTLQSYLCCRGQVRMTSLSAVSCCVPLRW
jgi:hypothetical protein